MKVVTASADNLLNDKETSVVEVQNHELNEQLMLINQLGKADKADLFKDPTMLQLLSDLEKLDEKKKSHILSVLDGFLQLVKIKNIAAL